MAKSDGMSSIAFPTLGCGKLGYQVKDVVSCFQHAAGSVGGLQVTGAGYFADFYVVYERHWLLTLCTIFSLGFCQTRLFLCSACVMSGPSVFLLWKKISRLCSLHFIQAECTTNDVRVLNANLQRKSCTIGANNHIQVHVCCYNPPALVCMSVCLCVHLCLSVTTITKTIVDGFVPNFMGRFLGEKRRPSSCFITIGRGMWK